MENQWKTTIEKHYTKEELRSMKVKARKTKYLRLQEMSMIHDIGFEF